MFKRPLSKYTSESNIDGMPTEDEQYQIACKCAKFYFKWHGIPKGTLLEFGDYITIAWWYISKLVNKGRYNRAYLFKYTMYKIRQAIQVHQEKRQNMVYNSFIGDAYWKVPNAKLFIENLDSNYKTLLRHWCKTTHSRRNGNWLGRLLAYLHLVELVSLDELSDIFDIEKRKLGTKIGTTLFLARRYYMSDKEHKYAESLDYSYCLVKN